jgi:hypothetical protein
MNCRESSIGWPMPTDRENQIMSFGKELLQSAEEALAIAEGRAEPAKVKALQDALIEGEQSGEPQPFDFDASKARKRAEFEGKG